MPFNKSAPKASRHRATGLHYVYPEEKGYRRIRKGNSFSYLGLSGKTLKNPRILKRIDSLKIPPAWEQVWICPDPKGHLQARGIDAMGRFQYRYHPDWQQHRSEKKFEALHEFGTKLPLLRKQIRRDLQRNRPDKLMLCALALSIMDETFLRSGNRVYEKAHGSYGLTTLKNRHLRLNGSHALFRFKGKKGVRQEVRLMRKDLIRILKKVTALPGQQLFQYLDEEKNVQHLRSDDLNTYLRAVLGDGFSCKDFRTWAGSLSATEFILERQQNPGDEPGGLSVLIDYVAKKLGNTPAVCKKYYIHPALIDLYESGAGLDCPPGSRSSDRNRLETLLLNFLQKMRG